MIKWAAPRIHAHRDCEISIRNIIFAPRRDDITSLEQFRQDIWDHDIGFHPAFDTEQRNGTTQREDRTDFYLFTDAMTLEISLIIITLSLIDLNL